MIGSVGFDSVEAAKVVGEACGVAEDVGEAVSSERASSTLRFEHGQRDVSGVEQLMEPGDGLLGPADSAGVNSTSRCALLCS